jgi:hypothetical protein
MSRMTSASLHVKIKPARHNVRLIQGAQLDGAHQHTVPIPALTVGITALPAHSHTGYTPQHSHGGINGGLTTTGSTGIDHGHALALGSHTHVINPVNPFIDTGVPNGWNALKYDTTTINGQAVVTQVRLNAFANAQGGGGHTHGEKPPDWNPGASVTALGLTNRNLDSGSAAINFSTTTFLLTGTATASDNAGHLIGMTTAISTTTTPAGTDPTDGGSHTHDLFPDIAETSLGGYVQVWINSGDGVFVDRSPELGGPWNGRDVDIKGNVFVDSNGAQVSGTGMERFLQAPGKVVGIRIVAVNSSGNPTGITNVQVSGTWEFDKYAINSTIFAGAGGG